MSGENQETQGQQPGEAGAADDLTSALGGGGETEFVVASDEKKPMNQQLLYLLLLVVVGGAVTFYMYKRQGPSSAAAATNAEAAKASKTINSFLTSGPGGIKAMQTMLKDTEKVVQQFNEYPSMKQTPLSELHTNPFRFSPVNKGENPDAEALKKKREEEKQAAIKASEGLQLQSIIHSGTRKACMINNTLYTEGQQVDQFTIEAIEKSRVIVRTGPYRFELRMQR
jgi:hypothetical protein